MDERTPLVHNTTTTTTTHPPTRKDTDFRTINLLCLSLFLANSSSGLSRPPRIQLAEDSFCLDYTRSGHSGILGGTDKVTWARMQVAILIVSSAGLDALSALLACLPWGVVADRIGRKPVIVLALIGIALGQAWWIIVLSLHPLLSVWAGLFSSASMLLGGGLSVLAALFISIASDATDDSTRAAAFLRLHVASMLGLLISPSLSSAMMKIAGPWPVMGMAVACLLLSGATFMLIRETDRVPLSTPSSGRSTLSSVRIHRGEGFSLFKTPALVLLLLATFFSQPIWPATIYFLPLFISTRYRIKTESTGYILTAYVIVQVFQALIGLPLVSRYMLVENPVASFRRIVQTDTERKRDLLIGRWSFLILLPALLLLGFATRLWSFVLRLFVLALGSGYDSYTKSLMSLYVDKQHQSTLFSLVAMIEVLGTTFSYVMVLQLSSSGFRLGGWWVDLPYFEIFVLTALAAGPLFLLRLPAEPALEDVQCEGSGTAVPES